MLISQLQAEILMTMIGEGLVKAMGDLGINM